MRFLDAIKTLLNPVGFYKIRGKTKTVRVYKAKGYFTQLYWLDQMFIRSKFNGGFPLSRRLTAAKMILLGQAVRLPESDCTLARLIDIVRSPI